MIRKLVVANLSLLAILLASAIVNAWTHGSVAQSVLSFLSVSGTDPTLGNDSTNRVLINGFETLSGANIASQFADGGLESLTINTLMSPGGVNNSTDKTTWYPYKSVANYHASGQKFGSINSMFCYGMGDCGPNSTEVNYAGGPVSGDEGSSSVFQSSQQQQTLVLATTSGSTTQSSCNTTLTGSVSRPTVGGSATSIPTQSVSVASTTGCNVNDWLAVGVSTPSGSSYLEAVQITAVGGGNITAAFRLPHSSSEPVLGALVIGISGMGADWGQDRVLVNLSGTTYSTGTVTGSGTSWTGTGSGTTWTNGMVGGTANNIGCIALTNDDYSGAPFNGSGASSTLKSWYQITAVNSNTSLGIYSFSVAGDGSYHGRGVGAGAYQIKPCVRVLQVIGNNLVIAENSSTTWANGSTVELAITPYPDVTMLQYKMAKFNPGGTFRGWSNVTNSGSRSGGTGLVIDNQHMQDSGVITNAGSGYTASGTYPMTTSDGIPVTGGAGTGMRAQVTVAGNVITSFIVIEPGSGYNTGDVLSVSNTDVGGAGSGFQWTFNGGEKPVGWGVGMFIQGTQTAIDIDSAFSQAILLGTTNIASSKVAWNNTGSSLYYDKSHSALQIQTTGGGQGGLLAIDAANTSNNWAWMNFFGLMGTAPTTQSTLPTCDSSHEGMERSITDGNSTTFNASIAPAGTSHVKAYCDGTSYKIH